MLWYDYLRGYEFHFWSWQDNAEVVALSDGSTIAYRGFVLEALEVLSETGLPSFGSLLMAIAATNNSLTNVVDILAQKDTTVALSNLGEIYEDSIRFLRILQKLPLEYRQGPKRLQVLQVLFEGCHNALGIKDSKNIVAALKHHSNNHPSILAEKLSPTVAYDPYHHNSTSKDLKVIALLNRRFGGTVDIINAVAGLPPIDDLPIEPPQSEAVEPPLSKDFVTELLAEPKTFYIGALIPRIWSGLQIPFHHTVPSQQPLGGVSDLSNKGDLDRLLISEFANDDLLLLSRLANNEALYLQREIPPAKNDEERILLVDVSIRNWGTPKLMAFATALAIAKHPKTDIPCRIFCVGRDCVPVAIDTMPTLIDGLMQVSEGLYAAAGLEEFFNRYADKKEQELVLIGHPIAMAHPAMQKIISEHSDWFKYWVTVEQDGCIELYRHQHKSKKFIQQIRLPLEELWVKQTSLPITNPDKELEWPARYPLLFPCSSKVKQYLYAMDGTHFLIDVESTLLQYHGQGQLGQNKGLVMVWHKIYGNYDYFAIGKHTDGHYELLCFSRQKKEITIIHLGNGEEYVIPFSEWRYRNSQPSFIYRTNHFFYIDLGYHYKIHYNNMPRCVKIEGVPAELLSAQKKMFTEQKQMTIQATDYGSLLKNIHTVSVSRTGHLLLGKHQLSINHSVIKWKLGDAITHLSAVKAEATIPGQLFVFPCGSTVQVNRSGMLILRSGATQGLGQYDVLLEARGDSPIETIKTIKSFIDYSLASCKHLVDSCPSPLGLSVDQSEAERIVESLYITGATAKIIPAQEEQVIYLPLILEKALGVATDRCFAGNSLYHIDVGADALPVLSTDHFYQRIIKPFIQYILDHGT